MLLSFRSWLFIQFPLKRSFNIEMSQDTRTRKCLNRDGSHRSAVIQLTLSIPQRRIISIYTITQVILAFWLVLAYNLLEDRRTIDVIITKFFLLCFKMAERSENSVHLLSEWVKIR